MSFLQETVSYLFLFIHNLQERETNFSCKRPESKPFRLFRPHSLCHNNSVLPLSKKAATDKIETNKHSCVPVKLMHTKIWILHNFHVMKYSLNFFQPFKNIKILFSQWAQFAPALNKLNLYYALLSYSCLSRRYKPNITLSEISRTQKDRYCMFPLI